MVHVRNCPVGKRGRAYTDFYKNGKPQKYCMGYVDLMTDEPIKECRNCLDYIDGDQCEKDYEEAKGNGEIG